MFGMSPFPTGLFGFNMRSWYPTVCQPVSLCGFGGQSQTPARSGPIPSAKSEAANLLVFAVVFRPRLYFSAFSAQKSYVKSQNHGKNFLNR
jgi:hypothetical protein